MDWTTGHSQLHKMSFPVYDRRKYVCSANYNPKFAFIACWLPFLESVAQRSHAYLISSKYARPWTSTDLR